MSNVIAGVIQREAGTDPTNQFAVASVIYNRAQAGWSGGDPVAVVLAPDQFASPVNNPNASAQRFAQAIADGTLPQLGNTGTAMNFAANIPGNQAATRNVMTGGANIGGNYFSDNMGPPTSSFVAPSFGGDMNAGGNVVSSDPGNPNLQLTTEGNPTDAVDQGTAVTPDAAATENTANADQGGGQGGGGVTFNPTQHERTTVTGKALGLLGIPDIANAISEGFGAVGETIGTKVSEGISAAENYAGRFAVMLFAIAIFIAAIWFLVPKSTKDAALSAVTKVA